MKYVNDNLHAFTVKWHVIKDTDHNGIGTIGAMPSGAGPYCSSVS